MIKVIVNGDIYTIEHICFPDGTQNLRNMPDMYSTCSVHIIWYYAGDEEMTTLMFLNNYAREVCGVEHVYLSMPYIPNARMDRVKDPFEVFTLKYFANFINNLKFDEVFVLDPHSDVSTALIDRVTVLPLDPFLTWVINKTKPDVLFFPDAGAAKKYNSCNFLIPYLFGQKNRDWKTGRITGYSVVENKEVALEGAKILIIDDICSRGGTFLHAGNALRAYRPKEINLWVTHCENTIFAGSLLGAVSPIDHIYTTDSLHRAEHEKITTFCLEDTLPI